MAVVVAMFVAVILVLFVLAFVLRRVFIVCPPNRLLVLSGRPRRLADGRIVGYRLVFGGRVLRIPILETAQWLDLSSMLVEVNVTNAYTTDGVPVDLTGVANVKVSSDPSVVGNAVERFLDKGIEEIKIVVRETLEGNLRAAAATLSVDELRNDPDAVLNAVMQSQDFERLGLQLDTMKIQNVQVRGEVPVKQPEPAPPPEERVVFLDEPPAEAPKEKVPAGGEGTAPDPAGLARLADSTSSPREREELLKPFRDREVSLSIDVDSVTLTTTYDLPDEYRGGQTVVGKAFGSLVVAVSFPKDGSEDVKALQRGATLSVSARVLRWDHLFGRLAAVAPGTGR